MNKNNQTSEILPFPLPSMPNNDMIANEFHTLFTDEVQGETIKISEDHRRFTFYMTDFGEDKRGLHEAYNELRSAGPDDVLEMRISSNGGYVDEGEILQNITNEKFPGRTITVLDSKGYSMGALAFCMGDYRLVYENSTIMFHNYSGGAYGKGEELMTQVKHQDAHLKRFFNSVIVGLSNKEINRMYKGEDFWFDALEMCKRGIATEVSIFGYVIPAEDYVKLMKQVKKKAKKLKLKNGIGSLQEAQQVYDIDVFEKYLEKKQAESEAQMADKVKNIEDEVFGKEGEKVANTEQSEVTEEPTKKPKKKNKKSKGDTDLCPVIENSRKGK